MKKKIIFTLLSIISISWASFAVAKTIVTTNIVPTSTNTNSAQFSGYVSNGADFDLFLSGNIANSSFPTDVYWLDTQPFNVSVPKNGTWTNPIFYYIDSYRRGVPDNKRGCHFEFRMVNNQLQIAYAQRGKVKCIVNGNMISVNTNS